jgi:hypothetical protein
MYTVKQFFSLSFSSAIVSSSLKSMEANYIYIGKGATNLQQPIIQNDSRTANQSLTANTMVIPDHTK